MKASELIELLEKKVKIHGDQEVFLHGEEDDFDVRTIVVRESTEGEINGFIIADQETAFAFVENDDLDDDAEYDEAEDGYF